MTRTSQWLAVALMTAGALAGCGRKVPDRAPPTPTMAPTPSPATPAAPATKMPSSPATSPSTTTPGR
ncbi:hypothetical protein [Pigmentiphaga litoralis]|uniref:Putative small lipoprotein YifL n=1 Tax=Pigmentiphaga litoralis TaxID=516702 RepID=A0A7Y9LN36_9BURK|nr:hypothetical protein [Pigmentiphaga litoralis]NYE24080.1 putative small lipoprotein YifL [Pigmentiphaga litoralis]NYE82306.1 putative small lipoprotein YifL [Pigmentiphaga litoralis]